ncbi:hypothetical protein EJ05DRAFT_433981 [Pseudovirgaria hyperparasitica]|uniref:Atos-like conserved domain-containing protein n=1 Tax=Pseudovirgaria hyperparasitica TaxID=470096 RepID=A0A6A6WK50_9PEZI|nr:uncharacterized protein EJ05DRAFT_433981 [Pseudovirgaria hyperparasitica]KAF2762381.1 hypothetical protein EJ05DRAFT_433981 [Pseudovirgaria hyperparasitica]
MSREELIERIKRQKSPTLQRRNVGSDGRASPISRTSSPRPSGSPLLPALELKTSPKSGTEAQPAPSSNEVGLQIERPRSALHSGDFRPYKDSAKEGGGSVSAIATSPTVPWHRDFPISAHPSANVAANSGHMDAVYQRFSGETRNRNISQTSLSSVMLLPPTSPLVQQSNNTDLDFSPKPQMMSRSPTKESRRHTFSPHSFQTLRSSSVTSTPTARHLPSLRREGTYPYQAHQPRRSLSNVPNLYSNSTPQTPLLSPRRPSISSEISPLHHAPMVGSYEESILRGRMSTTPSKPLNFLAQIGVLGKGHCRANLKCPPHVTVPFPAVFYSYNSGTGRVADDSPSPYVGLIDLEHSLKPPEEMDDKSRRRKRNKAAVQAGTQTPPAGSNDAAEASNKQRKQEKRKRRSASPRAPPGGCYRIPQQGQLQIVIKNPNKTAVKLFLVPYDLSDMEPGQKTFIRQRSYSAGPILDMPVAARKNYGTDRPEASLSHSDDPNDRPVLRYLIHLNICCPSQNKYYLYKGVRVVFANRVPDGKEKLRNEVQLPEPRYSLYKPSRDSMSFTAPSAAATQLTSDIANRRRSSGFALSQHMLENMDGFGAHTPTNAYPRSSPYTTFSPSFSPVPFSLSKLDTLQSRPSSRGQQSTNDPMEDRSRPNSNSTSSPQSPGAEEAYEKFTRGVSGYTSPGSQQSRLAGEGLLARKLRGLDM